MYEVNLNSRTSVSGTNAGVDGRKVAEHEETILPGSATKMVCILFSKNLIIIPFGNLGIAEFQHSRKNDSFGVGRRLKMVDNKRLLNKAEYDMNNYEARGGCYPLRPQLSSEICLIIHHMKTEINNCFMIYSKYFEGLSSILTSK